MHSSKYLIAHLTARLPSSSPVAIDVLAILSLALIAAYIIRTAYRNAQKLRGFCAKKCPCFQRCCPRICYPPETSSGDNSHGGWRRDSNTRHVSLDVDVARRKNAAK